MDKVRVLLVEDFLDPSKLNVLSKSLAVFGGKYFDLP
jgi:hypothetical protein